MHRVAIAILNWNGKKFLEDFLPSVMEHSREAHVVVIDNGSTDTSLEFLTQHYPEIEQVVLDQNYGFCGGYNKGLAQISAEYFVLLNSDVEVTEGWLDPILSVMDADHSVAACQPKILTHYQKDQFEHAGGAGGYIDALGYPFCRGRIFGSFEKDKGQYDDIAEIFWATGACLVIRSEVYKQLNGLEDTFFAHMEEIDLCWRIKNHGFRILYVGASTVYHVGGGTLPKSNPRKTFLNFRNGLVMMFKNLPRYKLIPVMFGRMCLDGVAFFEFLIVGYPRDAWAVFRAHMSFYANIRTWTKTRKTAQRGNLRFKHKEVYRGSAVFQHFILRKKTFDKLGMDINSFPLSAFPTKDKKKDRKAV